MMDRRKFLRLSGAGLGAVLVDSAVPGIATAGEERLALLYDSSKCIGCRACQMACKQWNRLGPVSTDADALHESPVGLAPDVWTLIEVAQHPQNDRQGWSFIKKGCMHCGNPACVAACPTSALKKQPNGLVTLEPELCNGCGYCSQFCPFHVPQMRVTDLFMGGAKATKCTFCQDRVAMSLRPYCAQSCPAGALDWGQREVMLEQAQERVEALKAGGYSQANLYGESPLGGLGRLHVLLAPPEAYGLPVEPGYPFGATLWKKVVRPVGEVAFGATLLGLVAAFFAVRRKVRMEEVE